MHSKLKRPQELIIDQFPFDIGSITEIATPTFGNTEPNAGFILDEDVEKLVASEFNKE